VDGDAGGPRFWFELAAPGARGSLRQFRRPEEVRARLRRGLGQGDEPGSVSRLK
jgi:hypothetical protein